MLPEELVRKLLAENNLCVMATASKDGKPEAASMYFAEDTDYNLYFETCTTYRKYINLKSNPQASIVVTQLPYTVQMDGTVEELAEQESEKAKQRLTAKLGKTSKKYDDPRICFFKFTPTWIRVLTDPKWPPEYSVIKG